MELETILSPRPGWGCRVGPLSVVAAAQSLQPKGNCGMRGALRQAPRAEFAGTGGFPNSKGHETTATWGTGGLGGGADSESVGVWSAR